MRDRLREVGQKNGSELFGSHSFPRFLLPFLQRAAKTRCREKIQRRSPSLSFPLFLPGGDEKYRLSPSLRGAQIGNLFRVTSEVGKLIILLFCMSSPPGLARSQSVRRTSARKFAAISDRATRRARSTRRHLFSAAENDSSARSFISHLPEMAASQKKRKAVTIRGFSRRKTLERSVLFVERSLRCS